MKKHFKSIDFIGKSGKFLEVHATTTRNKEIAILFISNKYDRAFNLRTESYEHIENKEMLNEILRKVKIKLELGSFREELPQFYNIERLENIKKSSKKKPLYYIKTFLRVPNGSNCGLYKYDILQVDKGKIENITYSFKKQYSSDNYDMIGPSWFMDELRGKGFNIAREL